MNNITIIFKAGNKRSRPQNNFIFVIICSQIKHLLHCKKRQITIWFTWIKCEANLIILFLELYEGSMVMFTTPGDTHNPVKVGWLWKLPLGQVMERSGACKYSKCTEKQKQKNKSEGHRLHKSTWGFMIKYSKRLSAVCSSRNTSHCPEDTGTGCNLY